MVEAHVAFDRLGKLASRAQARHEMDSAHDGLTAWFGVTFLGQDETGVADRIIEDGQAEGVDAVMVDEDEKVVYFIQTKTVTSFANTGKAIPENEIKLFSEGCRLLIRGDYRGKITGDLENLVDEFRQLDATGDYATKLLFLSMKGDPDSTKFLDQLCSDLPNCTYEIVTFTKLVGYYEKYLQRMAKAPERITLEVVKNVLKKDEPHKARVFTIRAKDLARVYDEHGVTLLQDNVRMLVHSPDAPGVNSKIKATASGDESDDFWYYNNGITIVCREIGETAAEKVINVFEPQIINGAQTTLSLHSAYVSGSLREDAQVLVRVIETADVELKEKITLYSNSQSSIKLRDLVSNDPIQDNIQTALLSSYGYYYQRKRGEVATLYPTQADLEKLLGKNPQRKIISSEDAAQAFLAMFSDKPGVVKNQKYRIFSRTSDGFYDEVFNAKNDLLPEQLLAAWLLFGYLDSKRRKYKRDFRKAKALEGEARWKVHQDDFLLHNEFFLLNLYRDYLENAGYGLQTKEGLDKLITACVEQPTKLDATYDRLRVLFRSLTEELRKDRTYYHNRFFKNDKGIATVRADIVRHDPFVKLLPPSARANSLT